MTKHNQAQLRPDGTTSHPVTEILELLGRRWVLRILWELYDNPAGFRELQARCDGMSASVLSQRLKELVHADILEQDEHLRYHFSEEGRELTHILMQIKQWVAQKEERKQRDQAGE